MGFHSQFNRCDSPRVTEAGDPAVLALAAEYYPEIAYPVSPRQFSGCQLQGNPTTVLPERIRKAAATPATGVLCRQDP